MLQAKPQTNSLICQTFIIFEEILDVQIIVYSSTKAGDPIHKEKTRGGTIFLYHTPEGAGHFDAIVSITGFLGVPYYCM